MKNLEAANETSIISMDKALIHAAVSVASDLQMRAGDATYVAVAHQLQVPLISWDKEQLKKLKLSSPRLLLTNMYFQKKRSQLLYTLLPCSKRLAEPPRV